MANEFYLSALLACGEKHGDKIRITSETVREVNIKLKILEMVAERQVLKGVSDGRFITRVPK